MKHLATILSILSFATLVYSDVANCGGRATLGFTQRSGNTDSDLAYGSIELDNKIKETPLHLFVNGAIGHEAENGKRNRTVANVKSGANLKARKDGYFLSYTLTGEHDGEANLKYRFLEGAGVGTFLEDSDEFKCSVELGLACTEERLDGRDNYFAANAVQELNWFPKQDGKTKVFEKATALVDLSKVDHYILHGEIGIAAPVSDDFGVEIKYVVDYNSEPASRKEKCDRVLLGSLTHSF